MAVRAPSAERRRGKVIAIFSSGKAQTSANLTALAGRKEPVDFVPCELGLRKKRGMTGPSKGLMNLHPP